VQQTGASFDHFVSSQHERGWYFMVDYFCGLKVDHKLESGWLLNRRS